MKSHIENNKYKKKPLYRKDNTKARNHINRSTEHARYDRNTKEGLKRSMRPAKGNTKIGRDYTPLFMFLLSKVGQKWDDIYSEAVSRLDVSDPIWYIVCRDDEDKSVDVVRINESSYYSKLYIDEDGVLKKVNPDLTNEMLYPSCWCCTHTFNGKPYINKYIDYTLDLNPGNPSLKLNIK